MANTLVSSIGSSLTGFFEFCESQNNEISAIELKNLYDLFFSVDPTTTVASAEPPSVTEAPVKANARTKAAAKPRSEQTSLVSIDLLDKRVVKKTKLTELKMYAKERGLSAPGTKADVIEILLKYEKEQDDAPTEPEPEAIPEDTPIQVKKPKTKGSKLSEPATQIKISIIKRHGLNLVWCRENVKDEEIYFVLDDDNNVFGWLSAEDEINAIINIQALQDKHCVMADSMKLKYLVPDNLDA